MIWLLTAALAGTCTYSPTTWSTAEARSLPDRSVAKPRDALTEEERGPFGCTPCEEDQVAHTLGNGVSFTACAAVVERLAHALEKAIEQGAVVETVSVYRPVRSTGPLDAGGRRTELSAHAYGVAVDINAARNGLYADCPTFTASCRLLRGGAWTPGEDPRSITADSPLVGAFAEIGWAWGGAMDGDQKDFMHFAPR